MIKKGYRANLERKRQLRLETTPAERLLWAKLRSKQFYNMKFRRQHGIGPYIVDFYCPEKSTFIEVDGDTHGEDEQVHYDKRRETYLRGLGLQIIRYFNDDVFNNLEGVLTDLSEKLDCCDSDET